MFKSYIRRCGGKVRAHFVTACPIPGKAAHQFSVYKITTKNLHIPFFVLKNGGKWD